MHTLLTIIDLVEIIYMTSVYMIIQGVLDPRGMKAQFQIDTQNMKHSRYSQDLKRPNEQYQKYERVYMETPTRESLHEQ